MDNPMLLDVPPVQVEVGQVWRAWEVYLTWDSATRAGSATSSLTVMRFGVRPATSSSSTQAR